MQSWFRKAPLAFMLPTISPTLLPALIINSSLHTGIFPTAFKQAWVTPLLKKITLNTSLLVTYRPVSLLSFIAKTREQVAFNQVSTFLLLNNQLDVNQSGFKKFHSTETAFCKSSVPNHQFLFSWTCLLHWTLNHQILLSTSHYMHHRYSSPQLGLSGSH